MQLKALQRAAREGTVFVNPEELARMAETQAGFVTEQKQNFSKRNLAKVYGESGRAQRQEMLAIVAKGRS